MASEQRRAVAYIRVSLEEMAEKGVSLDAQRARVTAYCAAQGLDLVEVVEDPGASGKSLDRPGLQRALAMLGVSADTFVVPTLDRLTRRVRDWGYLEAEYFTTKASFLSAGDHVDVHSAGGRFVLNILFSKAQYEREQTAERTSTAMKHKAATGEFVGGKPPFGYSVSEDGKLAQVAAEQHVIAAAKAAKARGLSLRAIAAELDVAGMRSRAGKPFAAAQVARMLEG